jgi:hypothetical protein
LKAAGRQPDFRHLHRRKEVVNLPTRPLARVRYLLEGVLPFWPDSNVDLGRKQIDIIEAELSVRKTISESEYSICGS